MPSGLIHLPASSVVPVAFDATSAGGSNATGFGTSCGTTVSHTSAGLNRYGIAAFQARFGGQTSAGQTRTVTWGGAAMTQLGIVVLGSDCSAEIWGIAGQAAGAQTVSATLSSGVNTGRAIALATASFTGVGSVITPVTTNNGSGTANSLTVASATGEMIAQAFGGVSTGAQTGYNQTLDKNIGSSDGFSVILLGHAFGAASVGFSSTNAASGLWAGLGVRLLPF